MILADKITEERKRNGWSQEELASQLGVSRQAVSKWESAGSVPDLQRILQLAQLFGVTTDYLLKDEMTPEIISENTVYEENAKPVRKVSMEEANEFLDMKRKGAVTVANAVTMCILSPALLVILGSMADDHVFHVSDALASTLGCIFLFGMIAAAVYQFITYGIREEHMEHLEKENFETEYGVTGMVRERRNSYEPMFARGIAIGVVLCILSVIPIVLAGSLGAPDYVCGIFVGVLLLILGMGVNGIIRVSMVKGSYDTLLQEGEFSKEEKQMKKKTDPFSGAYWCFVTAIYLGWSFWTRRWEITWILWPVAGVLFAAIYGVIKMFFSKEE